MTGRIASTLAVLTTVIVMGFALRPVSGALPAPKLRLAATSERVRILNSKEGEAILHKRGWLPGQRVTGKVAIENTGGGQAVFRLSANQLADAPGPRGGKLSRATRIRVVRKRPIIDGFETVYAGQLTNLRGTRVGDWPSEGTRYFRFRATLRPPKGRAADRYQASELRFGLRWSATAAR